MKRVIISGMPRSGTSWTAKVFSFLPDHTYYREPDNADRVPGARREDAWLYVPDSASAPDEWAGHMTRALSGQIATTFTLTQNLGPIVSNLPKRLQRFANHAPALFLTKPNVLVKLVRGNLALAWMRRSFPEASIISLARHPVGQFASFKKLGWEPKTQLLLQDARLVEDHLADFTAHIARAETFWERAGAFWGAVNHVIHRQQQADGAFPVIPFEWLCREPEKNFGKLFQASGLAFPEEARDFLRASDQAGDGGTYSLQRDTRKQIDAWKASVSEADISACRAFAEPFELPYYPDFDPWKAQPVWGSAPRPSDQSA